MQGNIDLLSISNMVDFAKEVFVSLHNLDPETEEDQVPDCEFDFDVNDSRSD